MRRQFVVGRGAIGMVVVVAWAVSAFSQQPSAVNRQADPTRTEIGELNGASFRIDMPEKWNKGLVISNHGYSAAPVIQRQGPLRGLSALLFAEGYAIAQSGYAAGGWAIEEAVTDNENLRRYFIAKYGKPSETWATGGAMGAYVAMTMIEKCPAGYDGALSYSGPLASYRIKSFDTRMLFDFYFPGVFPPLEETPKDFRYGGDADKKVKEAIAKNPEKAEIVRRFSGMKNLDDLARRLTFNTFTLRELQLRSGGNPFDNRGTIYMVDDDLQKVNAGVKRYAADPQALVYMRAWGSPSGRLEKPLLDIHTIYDPISDIDRVMPYQQLVFQTGCQDMFVQQFVDNEGHGGVPGDVLLKGFHQLRAWRQGGAPPPFGLVK